MTPEDLARQGVVKNLDGAGEAIAGWMSVQNPVLRELHKSDIAGHAWGFPAPVWIAWNSVSSFSRDSQTSWRARAIRQTSLTLSRSSR